MFSHHQVNAARFVPAEISVHPCLHAISSRHSQVCMRASFSLLAPSLALLALLALLGDLMKADLGLGARIRAKVQHLLHSSKKQDLEPGLTSCEWKKTICEPHQITLKAICIRQGGRGCKFLDEGLYKVQPACMPALCLI